MTKSQIIVGVEKCRKWKELPGWKAVVKDNWGSKKYEIMWRGGNSSFENYSETWQFKMGILDYDGFLYSPYITEKKYFGTNVKNAVRFLFLKTQEPKRKKNPVK